MPGINEDDTRASQAKMILSHIELEVLYIYTYMYIIYVYIYMGIMEKDMETTTL